MKYNLFTFANTHSAIEAQKILDKSVPFIIMPTLREISKSCGISIKVSEENYASAYEKLKENMDFSMVKCYEVISESGINTISQL